MDEPINPILFRTTAKFLTRAVERPSFKKDHEYIDYALSVLSRTDRHPLFGPMLNDLEYRNESLEKSVSKAEDARNLGNNLFKEKQMADALNSYTSSISFAIPGSTQLALAYGNRSAVLFHKQYYKECLEDIERALEINFPQEKRDKLLKRQAKATKLLPTQKKVTFHGVVPTIPNVNTNMPSASDCLRINENEQYGRHIVATRDINPEEILLVEKPYSSVVSPNINSPTYCFECLELCYNLIPCKKCAGVLYCSKDCRRKAFVAYHRHECAILTTFGYDIINWNATRMTLKAIREYDKEETDIAQYRSDRYLELSKLSYHKGDTLHETLVTKAAGAAKVFYALKNYTDILSELDMDDEENFLKTLLFKNVCITTRNGSSVDMYNGGLGKEMGYANYSVFSLFNHACAENVARSFYGSTIVLKAKKHIQKGEQCFVNYGIFPMRQPVLERQEHIKRVYQFTCTCMACKQNWNIGTEHPEDPAVFILCALSKEVYFSENLSKRKKSVILKKTIEAAKKAELSSPYLGYVYSHEIYKYVLFDGNQITSF